MSKVWLHHLFGQVGNLAEKALKAASYLEETAGTIVTDLSIIAPDVKGTAVGNILDKVKEYILKHEPDVKKAEDFLAANQGLSTGDFLFMAGRYVLTFLHPGALTTDANIALNVAYKSLQLAAGKHPMPADEPEAPKVN